MGVYAKFCAEVREGNQWQLSKKEVFPFPEDSWQRKPGDRRLHWEFPFATPSSSINAFLGGIDNNNTGCPPIVNPRPFPPDVSKDSLECFSPGPWRLEGYWDDRKAETVDEILSCMTSGVFGFTCLTLSELIAFDYDQYLVDQSEDPPERLTYREFLGESYFENLNALRLLGPADDVRIVFLEHLLAA